MKRSTNKTLVLLLFFSAGKTCFMEGTPYGCFSFGSEYEIRTSHASGLPEVVGEQVKTPQCGVFTKRYPTKQGVRRAERPQATADDYATGAGNEKFHPRRRRRMTVRPGRAMKSPTPQATADNYATGAGNEKSPGTKAASPFTIIRKYCIIQSG